MKRVCICGHFGFGKELLNGQTIKTRILSDELKKELGENEVLLIDTHGGIKSLTRLSIQCFKAMGVCENVVILPAQNGLRIIAPMLSLYNLLFRRRLHYVVVGGWLPQFLEDKSGLEKLLKRFHGVYVETATMKEALERNGFRNVFVMPNCKELKILPEEELVYSEYPPYKVCTFSRVMKEKGVEEAVEAVKAVNEALGAVTYTLDIYGQVDAEQVDWFEELRKNFPHYIKYRGQVSYDKSVEVLKEYFAVLFPTYYSGEGFAGTLIDAFSAGVPVIASRWKYNEEIVVDQYNGAIVLPMNSEALADQLLRIKDKGEQWNKLKLNCLKQAEFYTPKSACFVLRNELV